MALPKTNLIWALLVLLMLQVFSLKTNALEPISTVEISRSAFTLNNSTNTYDATVTVKNTGNNPLSPPLRIVVESVSPRSVSLQFMDGKTTDDRPYIEVPLPNYRLAPSQSVSAFIQFSTLGPAIIDAQFYVLSNELTASNSRLINITGKYDVENGGESIGSGFLIKADGIVVGETNQQGHGSVNIVSSTQEISVSNAPEYFGSTILPLGDNSENLDLIVHDSAELSGEAKMRMDCIKYSMNSEPCGEFTVRFFQNGNQIIPDLIESIDYRNENGRTIKNLIPYFSKRADGTLVASPSNLYSKIGLSSGKKNIFVSIVDKNGISYFSEKPYYYAYISVIGKLLPPPSNPSLNLDGIPITVSVLNTDITFETQSTADGSFPLPLLPYSSISVLAQTISEGTAYISDGFATIKGNSELNVTLRGPTDILELVPEITVNQL